MRGNEGNLKKNYGKLKRKLVVWMLLVLLGLLVFARRQLFSEFGKQFSA